jgi:hypothetical protein
MTNTAYYKVVTDDELDEFLKEVNKSQEMSGDYPKKLLSLVEPIHAIDKNKWGVYYQEIVIQK